MIRQSVCHEHLEDSTNSITVSRRGQCVVHQWKKNPCTSWISYEQLQEIEFKRMADIQIYTDGSAPEGFASIVIVIFEPRNVNQYTAQVWKSDTHRTMFHSEELFTAPCSGCLIIATRCSNQRFY